LALGNWVNEAQDFLKRLRKDLETKKLVLCISLLKPIEERLGKTGQWKKSGKLGWKTKS